MIIMRSIEQAIKVNETAAQILRVLRKSELDASGIEAVLDTVNATLTETCDMHSPLVGVCYAGCCSDCSDDEDEAEETEDAESVPDATVEAASTVAGV